MNQLDQSQNLVIRVNSLDLTRCTEQCAIVMSLWVGRSERRPTATSGKTDQPGRRTKGGPSAHRRHTAQREAIASLMGYLHGSYCSARIVHLYPNHENVKDIWGVTTAPIGQFAGKEELGINLDLVASPADGSRDLLRGYDGGSVSVLAGGPRDSFVTLEQMAGNSEKPPNMYFVLAMRESVAMPPKTVAPNAAGPQPLPHVVRHADLICQALGTVSKRKPELVIGTLKEDQSVPFGSALRRYARVRTLRGSSVAAAMTVYFPRCGLDAYVGVTNRTTAILMATAARTTGGELYAFPVEQMPTPKPTYRVHPDTPVVSSKDLVPGDDVFLAATGITENLLLRGVRFPHRDTVSTHTVCLRSGTGSCRFIRQEHALEHKTFRILRASKGGHTAGGYDDSAYRDMTYADVLKGLVSPAPTKPRARRRK